MAQHKQPWIIYLLRYTLYFLYLPLLLTLLSEEVKADCQQHRSFVTLQPPSGVSHYHQLHVRSNIKGDVSLVDGDEFKVVLEKVTLTESEQKLITVNQTVLETETDYVYFLQLDVTAGTHTSAVIVLGSLIAVALVVILSSFSLWLYHRNRRRKQNRRHFSDETRRDADEGLRPSRPDNSDLIKAKPKKSLPQTESGHHQIYPAPPPPPSAPRGNRPPSGSLRRPPPGGAHVVALSLLSVVTVVWASCLMKPRVNVVIYLPPDIALDAAKLYFKLENQNEVRLHKWSGLNRTSVSIFDLPQAAPTANPPCDAAKLCPPAAAAQGLADCDAALQRCVCRRGYSMRDGICVDIDECSTPHHNCPKTATCQNTIGSYLCQCGYGYYGDKTTCAACSGACPRGFYQSAPCSLSGDRQCSRCTECRGSFFEARPCEGVHDRQCMHVAHPLLITKHTTHPHWIDGLKVEKSDNLFLENLHSTRNLETTYYVTDVTQASDFFWVRESGLRVNIGIMKANVIPKYYDVTHDSDNDYMLENPNNNEDKSKFNDVKKKFCRHPIPDYYSITLEIARDRTTAARYVTCGSRGSSPSCPRDVTSGDRWLMRSLNEPCQQMRTFPKTLRDAGNSIVCTQHNELLTEVFRHNFTVEKPIRFPPRKCRSAMIKCNKCKNEEKCHKSDVFLRRCCQIDCYNTKECKLASRPFCAQSPVECAMGDAYRYTIQPVFQNIKTEFQCQLKLQKPKTLYKLFFYVDVPGTTFETERQQEIVYNEDLAFQSRGQFKADFITVEHNTGLKLGDDVILLGKDAASGRVEKNYTLHDVKHEKDLRRKALTVHPISNTIRVASVQFKRPFAYSTSTWTKGDVCDKKSDLFTPVQKHFYDAGQYVTAAISRKREGYEYYLKNAANPPYIRFYVPGNTSVLWWYFKDSGPSLVTNSSLKTTLRQTSNGKIWAIDIQGIMTGCPAFLSIVINDRLEKEELFKYDMLIPNWGQKLDKTFDVHFSDARHSYHVYLTHLSFAARTLPLQPPTQGYDPEGQSRHWFTLGSIFILVGGFSVALFILYIYFEFTSSTSITEMTSSLQNSTLSSSCLPVHNLSPGQFTFVVVYMIVRMLYSVIFTFTVFFAIVMLFLYDDVTHLRRVTQTQRAISLAQNNASTVAQQHGNFEVVRQVELVANTQKACGSHVTELFDTIGRDLTRDVDLPMRNITSLMRMRIHRHMDAYRTKVEAHTQQLRDQLTQKMAPGFTKYNRFLGEIKDNDWLVYARLLYNNSELVEYFGKRDYTKREPRFASWMGLGEAEVTQQWTERFWERFHRLLPFFPTLPLFNTAHPSCSGASSDTSSDLELANRKDSTKFMSNSVIKGAQSGHTHPTGKYSFVLDDDDDVIQLQSKQRVQAPSELLTTPNVHILKIIFLVLDILLFVHRCSRMYLSALDLCQGFRSDVSFTLKSSRDAHVLENTGTHGGMTSSKTELKHLQVNGDARMKSLMSGAEKPSVTSAKPGHAPCDVSSSSLQQTACQQTHLTPSTKPTTVIISSLLCNPLLPKLLLLTVCALVLFLSCKFCIVHLTVLGLRDSGLFHTFLAGLKQQIKQTDAFLETQAKHLNDAVMTLFDSQSRAELRSLQAVLTFYNEENKRRTNNYIIEACAIERNVSNNLSCSVSTSPFLLDVPLLPCNFIPVAAHAVPDMNTNQFVDKLAQDFVPIFVAFRRLFLKLAQSVAIVTAIVLLSHLCGGVLFVWFKTREVFTQKGGGKATSGARRRRPRGSRISDSKVDSEESLEEEEVFTRMKYATKSPNPLHDPLIDHYSETKV